MITELDLRTKISTLVNEIREGKNRIWMVNNKLYLFEIDMVHLGNIVYTTFDPVTTLGEETWSVRYGVATTAYEVLFMPMVKGELPLRHIILPAIPGLPPEESSILPGCC